MTNLPVHAKIGTPLVSVTRPPRRAPEPISQTDYQRIKEALPLAFSGTQRNSTALAYRYILFTKVLRATGLRLAEALRLRPESFIRYGTETYAVVTRGKKRNNTDPEEIPMHPELVPELLAYMQGQGIRPGQPLFAFTPVMYERLFLRASLVALGRRATPHTIRSLYITDLIDRGVPVPAVSKTVGHVDERTTMRHYYNLTREKRQAIARAMLL